MKSFIIIGGGASGVIIAAQLLRRAQDATVRIFEKSGRLGAGIAYSTGNPSHLLNVRAGNMSAFPDEPEHFVNWLRTTDEGGGWDAQSFAPRRLYRDYLAGLLQPYHLEAHPRLFVEKVEAADIVLEDGKPVVVAAAGTRFSADAIILATGNEASIATPGKHVAEYWSSNGYFNIPIDAPVAIFGTGLPMIDSVLSLLDNGHKAEIFAISRRGLVPVRHLGGQPMQIGAEELTPASSLPSLVQHIRALMRKVEQKGGNWRDVMDGLRPHTQRLWSGLSVGQKVRFLRHLRPWWDVHRHRMAPAAADRIAAAVKSGQLKVMAGRLVSVRQDGEDIAVCYSPRGKGGEQMLRVAAIIDCRGGNQHFSTTRNPALIRLMEQGLARPDALDLGLDVTNDLQVVNARGEPSGPFFALGPVTKGMFWEVTAVPDIRVQAEKLAQRLLQE